MLPSHNFYAEFETASDSSTTIAQAFFVLVGGGIDLPAPRRECPERCCLSSSLPNRIQPQATTGTSMRWTVLVDVRSIGGHASKCPGGLIRVLQ